MTTDILIPLNHGSKHQDIEIRYCLRSIEKHLKNVGKIVIIGEHLHWMQNITYIPFTDDPRGCMRAENIYRKIMAGIRLVKDLSDNFLFMNDDHFLLKDFEAGEFPYLHRGPIVTHRISNEAQTRQMENTVKVLGGTPLDFDIHCPVVYNKELFIKTFENLEWPEYGFGIKTMYCNATWPSDSIVAEDRRQVEDLKFSEPAMKESIYRVLEGRQWFSIGDKTLRSGDMKQVLQELYPDKSKYEI